METIDNDGLKALINLIDSVSKVIESTKTGDYADRYLIYEMRIALREFIDQIKNTKLQRRFQEEENCHDRLSR